jgi:hypothetical protein
MKQILLMCGFMVLGGLTWELGRKCYQIKHPVPTITYVTKTNDYNQGAMDMFNLFSRKFNRGRPDGFNSTDVEFLDFSCDIMLKSIDNDFSFLREKKWETNSQALATSVENW